MSAAADGPPTPQPPPFPWDEVLHVGLHRLRLQPATLWAMSPRELSIMAGGRRGGQDAPDREALARLMASFPDGKA